MTLSERWTVFNRIVAGKALALASGLLRSAAFGLELLHLQHLHPLDLMRIA